MTCYDISISSRFQDKEIQHKADLYSRMAVLSSFKVLVYYHEYSDCLSENSFELTLLKNKQEEESTKLFSKF